MRSYLPSDDILQFFISDEGADESFDDVFVLFGELFDFLKLPQQFLVTESIFCDGVCGAVEEEVDGGSEGVGDLLQSRRVGGDLVAFVAPKMDVVDAERLKEKRARLSLCEYVPDQKTALRGFFL